METKNYNLQRNSAQKFGSVAFESGANPDFVVTSATRNAREMELLVNSLRVKDRLLERRIADYDQLRSVIPEKPSPKDDLQIIEPLDGSLTEGAP